MSLLAWVRIMQGLKLLLIVAVSVAVTWILTSSYCSNECECTVPTGKDKKVVSDKVMEERRKSIVPGTAFGLIVTKNGVVQMTIPVKDIGHTCVDGQEVIISKTLEKCKE